MLGDGGRIASLLSLNMLTRERLTTVAVCLGLVSPVVFGIDLSFNTYAILLKETFNFTQYEVEMVASTGVLGYGLSFLEVFVTGAFGVKVTFIVTWCLMPVTSGLMAVGALYHDIFREWPMVICFVHLITIMSSSMGSLATLRTTVDLCDKRHVGKVIGTYFVTYGLGKIFYASLVDFFFSHNLAGFFFTLALIFFVFFGIVYAVLYKSIVIQREGYSSLEENDPDGNGAAEETPTGSMIKSVFFHATFWPSVILMAASFTTVYNLTAIAAAVGVSNPILPVYCVTVFLVVTRAVLTLLLSVFPSDTFGFFLMTAASVVLAVDLLIAMFWLNNGTLFAVAALTGIAGAPSLIIAASILAKRFGKSHSAGIAGSFCLLYSIIQTLFQLAVGYLYDEQIRRHGRTGSKWCHGVDCFYVPFCMLFGISITISLVQATNCIVSVLRERWQWQKKIVFR